MGSSVEVPATDGTTDGSEDDGAVDNSVPNEDEEGDPIEDEALEPVEDEDANADGGICTETDGGLNYIEAGQVTDAVGNFFQDSCTFTGRLKESYCNKAGMGVELDYDCPEDFSCVDGACVLD